MYTLHMKTVEIEVPFGNLGYLVPEEGKFLLLHPCEGTKEVQTYQLVSLHAFM